MDCLINPGDVAQLGERQNRTLEAVGSTPIISTFSLLKRLADYFYFINRSYK
jgi:hypothetical protein